VVTTRERLLNVAARELAEHGYAGASLNRILSQAGVSKSSAYHHFSDKADLAVTVLERYWNVLEVEKQVETALASADAFWPALQVMHTRQITMAKDEPWMWSTLRCARDIMLSVPANHPAARRLEPALALIYDVVERGKRLGVIRKDIPDSLLMSLMMAVDGAADLWLAEHGRSLSRTRLKQIGDALQELMFALLAPKDMQHGKRPETNRRGAPPRSIARAPRQRRGSESSRVDRRAQGARAKSRADTVDGAR
jgi:AcrR family transcriptional regulator